MSPEERRPDPPIQPEPTEEPLIRIEDLDSAQPLEARPRVSTGEDFAPEIVDLPKDGPSMRVVDGTIQLDKEALEAEMDSVTSWLVEGVKNGDDKVLEVYLRNLDPFDEEEAEELKQRLEAAFKARDPSGLKLDELHVNIVSAGIAERNLIREGLKPELKRQPFYFKDKTGRVLEGEEDLDIVITRGEETQGAFQGSEFKAIVGSKQGIDAVFMPESLPKHKFQPNKFELRKDASDDVITIPLLRAEDGTEPSVGVIEVHKGPVDIMGILAHQEQLEARRERDRERRRQRREEEELRQREEERRRRQQFNPPPPSPSAGNWASGSG